jgi:hypothetical protein
MSSTKSHVEVFHLGGNTTNAEFNYTRLVLITVQKREKEKEKKKKRRKKEEKKADRLGRLDRQVPRCR